MDSTRWKQALNSCGVHVDGLVSFKRNVSGAAEGEGDDGTLVPLVVVLVVVLEEGAKILEVKKSWGQYLPWKSCRDKALAESTYSSF